MANQPVLISKHGGYKKLRSFRAAQQAYDGTVIFCERFVSKFSRTKDQMVQAARSGVQNIAEGSMASATSKKTELKLTGVARASLKALSVRRFLSDLSDRSDQSDSSDKSELSDILRKVSAEIAANTLICLIHQASYLLRQQLKALEQNFLTEGGFTERLYQARKQTRRFS